MEELFKTFIENRENIIDAITGFSDALFVIEYNNKIYSVTYCLDVKIVQMIDEISTNQTLEEIKQHKNYLIENEIDDEMTILSEDGPYFWSIFEKYN